MGAVMRLTQLRNRLLLSLAFGLVVFAGLLLWGDLGDVRGSFSLFHWTYLPAILALTFFNYAVRFLKWEYYLRLIGVRGLRIQTSLLIFFAGLGLTITPAKVGEWMKSYLLRETLGVPISRTAPIVVAERVTDGLAMLLLGLIGLLLLDQGWIFIAVVGILGMTIVLIFQYRPFAQWSIAFAVKLPVLRRYGGAIKEFYESAHMLFAPKPLAIAIAMGFVSWLGEGVAFYYVLKGLGATSSGELIAQSIFILAITTLAGAVFLLPGGLGVAEGGIAGLSKSLVGLSEGAAAAATLLIRLCTLWFGVAIGLVALGILLRRLRGQQAPCQGLP